MIGLNIGSYIVRKGCFALSFALISQKTCFLGTFSIFREDSFCHIAYFGNMLIHLFFSYCAYFCFQHPFYLHATFFIRCVISLVLETLLLTPFYMSIRVFCVCLLYSKFQATMPSTNLRFFKIFSNERSDTLAVKNECYLRYQSSRPLKNAKYNDNHKYLFIGFLTHFASLLPLNEVNGNIGKKLIRMGHSTFGILKTVISVKFLNTIQK